MSATQHKTSGLQFILLGVLLLVTYRPSAKPTGYADTAAPPTGLYRCWSGGFEHLEAGTLTLTSGGHYEDYRPDGGGSYSFSPSGASITFLDGDYHYWEYRGVYERSHEAQPGQNPADQPGERIVLMPLDAKDAIGSERPGEFQYCYRDAGR